MANGLLVKLKLLLDYLIIHETTYEVIVFLSQY